MLRIIKNRNFRGQTAIEYMLILGVVTAVIIVGFRTMMPSVKNKANQVFEAAAEGIMGNPPVARTTATNYP